jgi:uncharacterized protein YhdP
MASTTNPADFNLDLCKANLQLLAQTMNYAPVTDDASLEALWAQWRNSPFDSDLARLARARAKAIEQPPLSDSEPPA